MPPHEHPYSPAYAVNGHGYVSGALSVDHNGQAVTGRREALDAALERMRERLATIDMDFGDIVRLTYFVTDISLRNEANAQFVDNFPTPRPARTFVEISRLPYNASVEIDSTAVKGPVLR